MIESIDGITWMRITFQKMTASKHHRVDVPGDIGKFFRERLPEARRGWKRKLECNANAITIRSRVSLIHVCLTCTQRRERVRNKLIALAARLIKRAINLMAVHRGCGAVGH